MLKKLAVLLLAGFLVLSAPPGLYAQQAKTLTQLSTIDALLGGIYDGSMSLRQLKLYGDTGLGTFDALDGEMVLVDGTVYRVSADGSVQVPVRMKRRLLRQSPSSHPTRRNLCRAASA